MKKLLTILMLSSVCGLSLAEDTMGKIDKILLRPATDGHHTLRIYLKGLTKDRFECFSSRGQGYIETSDALSNVTTTQIQMLLSIVMSAKTTDKKVAFDSNVEGQPCNQVVSAYLFSY